MHNGDAKYKDDASETDNAAAEYKATVMAMDTGLAKAVSSGTGNGKRCEC